MVDPIRYFEESLKIRAICFDSGIDEETTRLICYRACQENLVGLPR